MVAKQQVCVNLLFEILQKNKVIDQYTRFEEALPRFRAAASRSLTPGQPLNPVQVAFSAAPGSAGTIDATVLDDAPKLDASTPVGRWRKMVDKALKEAMVDKALKEANPQTMLRLNRQLLATDTSGQRLFDTVTSGDMSSEIQVNAVKSLLARKVDVNSVWPNMTPLYQVVRSGDHDVALARLLLDAGADVFYPTNDPKTAVEEAITSKGTACTNLFLEHLHKAGTLDDFVAWEEILAEVAAVKEYVRETPTPGENADHAIATSAAGWRDLKVLPLKKAIAQMPTN